MEFNALFELTVSRLLDQQVICGITTPECYRFLQDEQHQNEVDQYLHRIGRSVSRTRDHLGFYCVYNHINDAKKRAATLKHFESFVVDLEGIIDWLRLVRATHPEARPLEAGMPLNESFLLAAIEESSSLTLQLEKIAQSLKRGGKSLAASVKLKSVLAYLKDHGYLKPMGTTGTQYTATAKWSLLYDQLEFIHQYDKLDEPDSDDSHQIDLLSGGQ